MERHWVLQRGWHLGLLMERHWVLQRGWHLGLLKVQQMDWQMDQNWARQRV